MGLETPVSRTKNKEYRFGVGVVRKQSTFTFVDGDIPTSRLLSCLALWSSTAVYVPGPSGR